MHAEPGGVLAPKANHIGFDTDDLTRAGMRAFTTGGPMQWKTGKPRARSAKAESIASAGTMALPAAPAMTTEQRELRYHLWATRQQAPKKLTDEQAAELI